MLAEIINNEIIRIILITFIPALELRASIPYGILKAGLPWLSVFLIAVLANIALGIAVYFFLDQIIHLFLHIKIVHKLYHKYVEITQRRIHKAVERWGELAVAVFIGIPLPGSGVYTGALAAYIVGLGYKKFFLATVIGVLIAAVIVTTVVLTGTSVFSWAANNGII